MKHEWTTETPTKAGYYYYIHISILPAIRWSQKYRCRVPHGPFGVYHVYLPGYDVPMDFDDKFWLGPLKRLLRKPPKCPDAIKKVIMANNMLKNL